ncbi:hypothetical protein GE061_011585 [Apolygus lucorum]|uniref:Uncharacterized protein n=1 Tax=Apolygus lucorum TaxID=248454 RepID=A0A8S9XZW3_APOLU|nr:hypothetical protein GE061_011585 [Apolygus lucorum]
MPLRRQRRAALPPPPDWKWRFSLSAAPALTAAVLLLVISRASAAIDRPNHPPRFIIEGDKTEIVLRLKEGPDTPVGSCCELRAHRAVPHQGQTMKMKTQETPKVTKKSRGYQS